MTKEEAFGMATKLDIPDYYLILRSNGWHYSSMEFYETQEPHTFYSLDYAIEWERYENGELTATSRDALPPRAPAPKMPEQAGISVREPLWWEQESAAHHIQLIALVKLRNEVRDMIRFGEL